MRLRITWELVVVVGLSALAVSVAAKLVGLGNSSQQLRLILGICAIFAIGFVVIRPWTGMTLLLATAPFQVRISDFPYRIGTNEVLLIAVAVIVLPRIRWRSVPSWLLWGYGGLVVGSAVATSIAVDKPLAAWGASRWALVGVVAVYTVERASRSESPAVSLARMYAIVSMVSVVVSGFAILQSRGIYWLFGPPYSPDRIDSSFGYYTNFAGFMAMTSVLALSCLLNAVINADRKGVGLHGTALTMSLIGVGLSLSRGALLALMVGLLVLVILAARRPLVLLGLAVLSAPFALSAWLAVPSVTREAFLVRLAAPIGSTEGTRFVLQNAGENALTASPLGLGYGQFQYYLASTGDVAWLSTLFFHSHRLPVQIGLDAGWIGLVGFCVLVLVPFHASVAQVRIGRAPLPMVGSVAAIAGLMAQGWFDYLAVETVFYVYFAFITCSAWLLATNRRDSLKSVATVTGRRHLLNQSPSE